jgi:succinate dehydrogenase / fumarate reductase iron-sulfur subunit
MYDCTHCFNCIEACPKGVAPMNQIMRLRRVAGSDEHIVDRNNGHRHEKAFVSLVKGYGLLHEAELLPRSYGGDSWFGKFHPAAGQELVSSLPAIVTALIRRKVTPKGALVGHKIPKDDLKEVQRIYEVVEGREKRDELNLYISATTRTAWATARATARTSWPRPAPATAPVRRPSRARPESKRRTPPPDEGRLLARLRQPRLHP